MRRLMLLALVAGLCPVGFMGCSDTATSTKEVEVSTPQGETTVTEEKTVEKSGENPPPAPNP